jgi:hypothetical protein
MKARGAKHQHYRKPGSCAERAAKPERAKQKGLNLAVQTF